MRNVDSAGGHGCVGAEGMLKICVSSSHFYCEPKTALNFFLIH